MDRPHVRPRVALWIPTPPSDLLATLEARLRASDRLEGRVRPQAVLIWKGPARSRSTKRTPSTGRRRADSGRSSLWTSPIDAVTGLSPARTEWQQRKAMHLH